MHLDIMCVGIFSMTSPICFLITIFYCLFFFFFFFWTYYDVIIPNFILFLYSYRRYDDVTNSATMASLTPLLWRH